MISIVRWPRSCVAARDVFAMAMVCCACGGTSYRTASSEPQRTQDRQPTRPASSQPDAVADLVAESIPDYDDASAAEANTGIGVEEPSPTHPAHTFSTGLVQCAKEFIDAQPPAKRQALIDALSFYSTTCDAVERRVVFQPPTIDGRDYRTTSNISFTGHLSRSKYAIWLRVQYHGDSWLFAERIKIAAAEFRWTSPILRFERDNTEEVWETAYVPYTKTLRPVVQRITGSTSAVVRFEGKKGYVDLEVTEEMKQDLKLMVEALEALGVP